MLIKLKSSKFVFNYDDEPYYCQCDMFIKSEELNPILYVVFTDIFTDISEFDKPSTTNCLISPVASCIHEIVDDFYETTEDFFKTHPQLDRYRVLFLQRHGDEIYLSLDFDKDSSKENKPVWEIISKNNKWQWLAALETWPITTWE